MMSVFQARVQPLYNNNDLILTFWSVRVNITMVKGKSGLFAAILEKAEGMSFLQALANGT